MFIFNLYAIVENVDTYAKMRGLIVMGELLIIVITLENCLRHSALDAESHEIAGQARNDEIILNLNSYK